MIKISETITLCPITLDSTSNIYQAIIANKDYLRTWLPFVDATIDESYTRNFAQASLDNHAIQYCIYESDKFIGLIGFNNLDSTNNKAEIGYWIIEEVQGRGIISRSVKELLILAFSDLNLNKVIIKAAVNNTKSRNIPERLGFTLEGIERDGEMLINNEYTDLAVYGLLKREFSI